MYTCSYLLQLTKKLKSTDVSKALTACFDILSAFVMNLLLVINDDANGSAITAVVFFGFLLVVYSGVTVFLEVVDVIRCQNRLRECCKSECSFMYCLPRNCGWNDLSRSNTNCRLPQCCDDALKYECCKRFSRCDWEFGLHCFQLFGLLLYMFGDNGLELFGDFPRHLGTSCGDDCEATLRAIARFVLALSTLIIVPTSLSKLIKQAKEITKIRKGEEKKEHNHAHEIVNEGTDEVTDEGTNEGANQSDYESVNALIYICQMLGLIVDYDALYTSVVGGVCPKGTFLHLGYVLLVIFCVAFLVTVSAFTTDAYYRWKKLQTSRVWLVVCCFLAALCVLTCWCHLLANNTMPLDCAVNEEKRAYLPKFLLSLVALICATVLVVIGIFAAAYREKKQKQEQDPLTMINN